MITKEEYLKSKEIVDKYEQLELQNVSDCIFTKKTHLVKSIHKDSKYYQEWTRVSSFLAAGLQGVDVIDLRDSCR